MLVKLRSLDGKRAHFDTNTKLRDDSVETNFEIGNILIRNFNLLR